MKSIESTVYEFGEFRLETENLLLMRDSEIVSLAPKAVEVLRALVENRGRLVTKEEIIERVWADTFVEEANLTNHISALRKALGENKSGKKFVETVPRRGYRFVAPVSEISGDALEITIHERSVTRIDEQVEIQIAPEELDEPPSRVGQNAAPRRKSARALIGFGVAAFALALLATFGAYWLLLRKAPIVFEPGVVRRLTTSGRATAPKISPDGRYFLYLQRDGDERSIWLRQIATGSDVRVTPPAPTEDVYGGVTFSPDGNLVYYSIRRRGEKYSTLYQVPSLGGAPKKVLENLIGAVAFAPDGKRFAFLRSAPETGDYALVIADADGGNERLVAERRRPNHFSGSLAWSPDGATILCPAFSNDNGFHYEFAAVSVADGAMQTIRSQNWQSADSIVWMPDGNSFFLVGQSQDSPVNQIWQVSYPSGETHQITKDANNYGNVGLTADGRFLIAGKLDQEAHLWIADRENAEASARQLTDGANNYDGIKGLGWTPTGQIVYHSKASGADAIWLAGADGGAARKIADGGDPQVSPDGRFVVFQSSGDHGLWRVALSDRSARRLTDAVDFTPSFSPDGRFVYFSRFQDQTNVYRVSVEGGAAPLVSDEFRTTSSPAVSPDGKTLAVAYGKVLKNPDAPASGLALINLETNQILKTFAVPEFKFGGNYEQPTLQWTNDGGAVNFIVLRDGVSNVWQQPIAGGDRVQITNFKDRRIFNFAVSPDHRRIAVARGRVSSDVVLIENVR